MSTPKNAVMLPGPFRQIFRDVAAAAPASGPAVSIEWGGKVYNFASAAEALKAGFHLGSPAK